MHRYKLILFLEGVDHGRNKPSIDFLDKMMKFFPDLNSNWIITGEGFMYQSKDKREIIKTKNIEKIVVFYDDNSFEELNP